MRTLGSFLDPWLFGVRKVSCSVRIAASHRHEHRSPALTRFTILGIQPHRTIAPPELQPDGRFVGLRELRCRLAQLREVRRVHGDLKHRTPHGDNAVPRGKVSGDWTGSEHLWRFKVSDGDVYCVSAIGQARVFENGDVYLTRNGLLDLLRR